jgi:hypothetical protein
MFMRLIPPFHSLASQLDGQSGRHPIKRMAVLRQLPYCVCQFRGIPSFPRIRRQPGQRLFSDNDPLALKRQKSADHFPQAAGQIGPLLARFPASRFGS